MSNGLSKTFKAIQFRLLQLLITVGLILCIVGGTSSYSSTGVYEPQATTKAGVLLYLVSWAILVGIAIFITTRHSNGPRDEQRLVWAVLIALPFILVRVVYSIISVFSHNRHFNLITGSVVIHVFMSVLEEMVVVIIYLAIGWKTEAVAPTNQGPIASRPWKGNLETRGATSESGHKESSNGITNENETNHQERSQRPTNQTGRRERRRRGPIHALVGAGIAAVKEKRSENTTPQ